MKYLILKKYVFQHKHSLRKSGQKYKRNFLIYLLLLETALKVEDFKLNPSKVNPKDVKKKNKSFKYRIHKMKKVVTF